MDAAGDETRTGGFPGAGGNGEDADAEALLHGLND